MAENANTPGARLNALLAAAGLAELEAGLSYQFEAYLSLLLRWNARVNLTAIRDEEGILARHFVESIACACALPAGIATLLDFGSGAGFPGVPIALCRPEIAVTLAESQGKKVAFLGEVVRELGIHTSIHGQRAEKLVRRFDCVTLRAVDRMGRSVETAGRLVGDGGCLALMTTEADRTRLQEAAGSRFAWDRVVSLPGGAKRLLALGSTRADGNF